MYITYTYTYMYITYTYIYIYTYTYSIGKKFSIYIKINLLVFVNIYHDVKINLHNLEFRLFELYILLVYIGVRSAFTVFKGC